MNASGFVSKRTSRTANGVHSSLAAQVTALIAVGYVFDNESAIALVTTYAVEGNAVVEGREEPGSGRALTTVALAGLWPLTDAWRLQGSIFASPAFSSFGRGQSAGGGLTFTLVRTWS